MAKNNTQTSSSINQAFLENIKRKQEETRRKAEEEAAAAGQETDVPVITSAPVTRQRIYPDIVKREEALRNELMEVEGRSRPDEFSQLPAGLGGPDVDEERAAKIRAELNRVEAEKEDRYAETVGGEAELARIRELENQIANVQDIPWPELQSGQQLDPFFYRKKRTELEEQLQKVKKDLEAKGVRIGVDESGQRVSVLTATPEMAGNDITTTLRKTIDGVSRGLQLSLGVDPKEATPLVRDEDTLVNITAELAPIIATAPSAAFAVAKFTDILIRRTPRAMQYVASVVAPAAGEALFATEETGTLTEDIFDADKLTATQKKYALMAEALGVDSTLNIVAGIGNKAVGLPVVGAFVRAIPNLLFGGEKATREAVGKRMADLIARSENAKTPEARADALAELRKQMGDNFEAQTGVSFNAYLEAAKKDAEMLADGVDPTVVQKSGNVAKLIPEDKFMPLTGDVIETPALQRLGAGVAGREGLPEVTGARGRQDTAIFEQSATVAEPTLPTTEVPRTPAQIEEQAEVAGASARSAINETVENKKALLSQQAQETAQELDQAVAGLGKQLQEGPASQAAQSANIGSVRAANEASDEAAGIFRASYTRADDARREAYEVYTDRAAEVEIPAQNFQRSFEGIVGEKEIANVVQILIDRNPLYAEVLQQLERQNAALARAIDDQVMEIARGLAGPNAKQDEFKAAVDRARNMVDMDAAKEAAGYKDIALDNVEGLLSAVNSELRASTGADRVALTNLSKGLNNIVTDAISGDEELLALRDLANSYYIGFQSIYKMVPSDAKTAFKYGDKVTDAELSVAQTAFQGVLRDAVKADNRTARQNLMNIKSQLNPEEAVQFNKALENFFLSDLYGKRISVDLADIATETDPKKVAAKADQVISRLREVANSPDLAYLDEFVPSVRAQLQKAADDIAKVKGNIADVQQTAQDKIDFFTKRIEETSSRPEAIFADAKANSKFGINSVKAAAKMIQSDDAGEIFTASWEVAGKIGDVGADGLTQAQRDLKTVMAQGVADMLLTDRAQLMEKAAGVSFPKLNRILKSKAFQAAFPEGDPTRKSIEQLAAITKGLQGRSAAKETGESITGSLKSAENLVDAFIRFEQGPLSREGRRSSMIARAFFAIVGGRARMGEVMTEAFMDPAVAARILEEQEMLIRQGLESSENAYKKALGRYMMQRLGVSSMDELNEEIQAYVVTSQMEDMGITEPAQ